jgi:hypothetical protein
MNWALLRGERHCFCSGVHGCGRRIRTADLSLCDLTHQSTFSMFFAEFTVEDEVPLVEEMFAHHYTRFEKVVPLAE